MRVRRLRKEAAHLEITAFINLIVVLVPFLLSIAVFTRLAVVDLSLPAQTSGAQVLKPDNLQLEVVMRANALEVGDRIGGLIKRIDSTANGYDLAALSAVMLQFKARFPDKTEASVLAEPNTSYDHAGAGDGRGACQPYGAGQEDRHGRAVPQHLDRRCAGARCALTEVSKP